MSFMREEALEAPQAVARFLESNAQALTDLGEKLRRDSPAVVLMSARGSSDHAAGYLKYLLEIMLGVPCASVGASVASVYAAPLKAQNALAITISQSGQSPDIVAFQHLAAKAGAITVALVNVAESPVGLNANICLPLLAGPERSVAATKSFIVSLAAATAVVAHWMDDANFKTAIQALPEQLYSASQIQWQALVELAHDATSLYVLGRGPSFPIAAETALKFKETSGLHAEAYSIAEVMHGPLELVGKDFPVFVYAQDDLSWPSTQQAVQRLKHSGAKVVVAGMEGMPSVRPHHALLEPILMIQTAYLAIEAVSQLRRRNPDAPRMLRKVTETV
jgi:glutamine---fructose-6-phosphate transaminase (isomerizing)